MSDKKILVLGGSGFVGEALLKALLRSNSGDQISALVHRHQPETGSGKVEWIHGDLLDLNASVLKSINPDIVFHLARINSTRFREWGRWGAGLKGYFANRKLLRNLNQLDKKVTLVYLSGSLMYGKGTHDESDPLKPSAFARQYVLAEKPFLRFNAYPNVTITMVRVPWVLGLGSWFKTFYHDPMKKNKVLKRYSPDHFRMMMIDVEDCAEQMVRLSHMNHKGIFNLYMEEQVLYHEFISILRETYEPSIVLDYSEKELRRDYEPAVFEAFHDEIILTTGFPDLRKKLEFRYTDVHQMLRERLAAFSKHE